MTNTQTTRCVPLTGDAAVRATLEAKIGIAASRIQHAPTRKIRETEQANLARFKQKLANLG